MNPSIGPRMWLVGQIAAALVSSEQYAQVFNGKKEAADSIVALADAILDRMGKQAEEP